MTTLIFLLQIVIEILNKKGVLYKPDNYSEESTQIVDTHHGTPCKKKGTKDLASTTVEQKCAKDQEGTQMLGEESSSTESFPSLNTLMQRSKETRKNGEKRPNPAKRGGKKKVSWRDDKIHVFILDCSLTNHYAFI